MLRWVSGTASFLPRGLDRLALGESPPGKAATRGPTVGWNTTADGGFKKNTKKKFQGVQELKIDGKAELPQKEQTEDGCGDQATETGEHGMRWTAKHGLEATDPVRKGV